MAEAAKQHRSEVVLEGLRFAEGPRWHEGRLWFSDMHDRMVLAMRPDGAVQRMCELDTEPSGLGWLPDGSLLLVSMPDRKLLRRDAKGQLSLHADLGDLARFHCNDMVVGPDGTAWVGNFGFDLHARAPFTTTELIRVSADGEASIAADDLAFPNGSVITPDGGTLIVAESFASRLTAFTIGADGTLEARRTWATLPNGWVPDGISLDAEGGIWVASPVGQVCVRVLEGGSITDRIDCDRGVYACMLGDTDRRTLYLCTAGDSDPAQTGVRSGRIERVRVAVPGAGWP